MARGMTQAMDPSNLTFQKGEAAHIEGKMIQPPMGWNNPSWNAGCTTDIDRLSPASNTSADSGNDMGPPRSRATSPSCPSEETRDGSLLETPTDDWCERGRCAPDEEGCRSDKVFPVTESELGGVSAVAPDGYFVDSEHNSSRTWTRSQTIVDVGEEASPDLYGRLLPSAARRELLPQGSTNDACRTQKRMGRRPVSLPALTTVWLPYDNHSAENMDSSSFDDTFWASMKQEAQEAEFAASASASTAVGESGSTLAGVQLPLQPQPQQTPSKKRPSPDSSLDNGGGEAKRRRADDFNVPSDFTASSTPTRLPFAGPQFLGQHHSPAPSSASHEPGLGQQRRCLEQQYQPAPASFDHGFNQGQQFQQQVQQHHGLVPHREIFPASFSCSFGSGQQVHQRHGQVPYRQSAPALINHQFGLGQPVQQPLPNPQASYYQPAHSPQILTLVQDQNRPVRHIPPTLQLPQDQLRNLNPRFVPQSQPPPPAQSQQSTVHPYGQQLLLSSPPPTPQGNQSFSLEHTQLSQFGWQSQYRQPVPPFHTANMTPIQRLDETAEDAQPPRNPTRTAQACDDCKLRKIKCEMDGEGSCVTCLKRGKECIMTDRNTKAKEPRGHKQRKEETIAMYRRVLREMGVDPDSLSADTHQESGGETASSHNNAPKLEPGQGPRSEAGGSHDSTANAETNQEQHTEWTSRPGGSHVGVKHIPGPLSVVGKTQLSVFGAILDTDCVPDPDTDEPPPNADHMPIYNKSVRAFEQSTAGVNPRRHMALPERDTAFGYVTWYFRAMNPYLPLLHEPTIMTLLERVYQEHDFRPTTCEMASIHMIFSIIYYQYGIRNWDDLDQREQLKALSNQHYHHVLSRLAEIEADCSIASVQVLALLAMHTRSFPKPGCAVLVCERALKQARDLQLNTGYNTEGATNLDNELRKRAWWVIISISCTLNGRRGQPQAVGLEAFDTPFPEPIHDELLLSGGVRHSPDLECPYINGIHGFKIVPLFIEMFSRLYAVRSIPARYETIIRDLERKATEWENELPNFLVLEHCPANHRVAALFLRGFLLEFRICLRHPAVACTANKTLLEENYAKCEALGQQILRQRQQLRVLKALDTTWYTASVHVVAIFSVLVAHWRRRHTTTIKQLNELREEMEAWNPILEDTSALLGGGPGLNTSLQAVVNRTLAMIENAIIQRGHQEEPQPLTPDSRGGEGSQKRAASQVAWQNGRNGKAQAEGGDLESYADWEAVVFKQGNAPAFDPRASPSLSPKSLPSAQPRPTGGPAVQWPSIMYPDQA